MLITLLAACALAHPGAIPANGAPSPPVPGYSLHWSDEFTGGAGAPEPTKWKAWAVGKRRDAMNVADAARLDGEGHLVITTSRVERAARSDRTGTVPIKSKETKESQDSAWEFRTGGVWTKDLFEPTFGYFEARIKFQSRLGHWGAFWLNCDGVGSLPGDETKAPTGGGAGGVEMDVIEFHHKMKNGQGQQTAQQTLHWDGYGKDHKSRGHTPGQTFDPADDFHVYGMLWTADEYVFFIDGVETWRVKKDASGTDSNGKPAAAVAPSTRAEHLILSLEVGDWAGKATERDTQEWPDSMVVDWVRVWQKEK